MVSAVSGTFLHTIGISPIKMDARRKRQHCREGSNMMKIDTFTKKVKLEIKMSSLTETININIAARAKNIHP